MTNTNVYKLFNRSIKWNTIEAIVYQSIITIHQILLFSVVDRLHYALIGTVFSLLYLSIVFLNLGFDKSLITFFNDYSKSKSNFKKFFISQIFIQLMLLMFVGINFVLFKDYIIDLFCINFKCPSLQTNSWMIIILLMLTESLKKTLRTFGQLAFMNKRTASIEIFTISLYFLFVWGHYLLTHQMNLISILVPLLIESLISNLFLSYILFRFYKNIDINNSNSTLSIVNIIINRFYLYINQISHLFFSGNFIITFLAYIFNLEQISILKLTNNIAVYITVLMERIFGITSAALLTHVKKFSLAIRNNALNISTEKLYKFLYATIIFLIINFKIISSYKIEIHETNWLGIYLFLFLLFFENFFITFEQFLIAEGKTYYLTIINGISAILFYLILDKSHLNLIEILITLLIIRLSCLLILKLICYLKLNVNLPYKISIKYILLYILCSLIFLFLHKLFIS